MLDHARTLLDRDGELLRLAAAPLPVGSQRLIEGYQTRLRDYPSDGPTWVRLGEAYLHGMNGIAEGARQVRGTAVNQVDAAEHVLVTGGTGVPTSALMLGVDR